MKTILLIAHLIAIATGTGMSIANYINIRIAAGRRATGGRHWPSSAASWRASRMW
jgi:hypothetical protein